MFQMANLQSSSDDVITNTITWIIFKICQMKCCKLKFHFMKNVQNYLSKKVSLSVSETGKKQNAILQL